MGDGNGNFERRTSPRTAGGKLRGRHRGAQQSHGSVDAAIIPISAQLPAVLEQTAARLPQLSVRNADILTFLKTDVADVLRRRNLAPGTLSPPRMDLLAPALEAVRYSELREAFACLIASSMDRELANAVLPAYVEVLKQLSADELGLLARIPAPGRAFAIGDLVCQLPSKEVVTAYRHIVPSEIAIACAHRSNIPQYIDNLMRLSLIYKPGGQTADAASYRRLGRLDFVQERSGQAPPAARMVLDRGVCSITNFGEQFRRACLVDIG